MDAYSFCWTLISWESERTKISLGKDNCGVKNDYEEDFDKSIKRVSYLYKYASFNIHFFQQCVSSFIAEVPDSLKIIDKICLTKNLNICSLSTGPGTHVVGFLYALHLLGKELKESVNFKFISKHISWRNVVCQMLNLMPLNVGKFASCKLIQCDVLTDITTKAQSYIKIADVLFLCHAFSSTNANKDATCRVSKDILQLLKPGALVFFIFNEDNSSNLKELNTFGHFLYGPTEITLEEMPYNKTIHALLQVPLVDTGSSYFGVWRKSDFTCEEKSLPVKLLAATPISESSEPLYGIKITKSDQAHVSKLHDSFKLTNNTSTSDSIITEAITSENVPILTESNASLKSSKTNFVKKKPCGLSAKTDSASSTQKIESPKDNPTNAESSLNSLVKTLERLVTNLEGFVNSQNTLGNPRDPQCFSTCPCHFQNMHAVTWNARHNFNSCACNRYSSCIENHPICPNNFNCNNCSMSSKHHSCQNGVSQAPHIVIPLQNITENALAQVFSLASQVNSSSD